MKRLLKGLIFVIIVSLLILWQIDHPVSFAQSGLVAIDITTVDVDGEGYIYSDGILTIQNQGTFLITGTTQTKKIKVSDSINGEVHITLRNLNIDASSLGGSAFDITGATVNLTLEGENILRSAAGFAGLQVPSGANLTITANSTGSLKAYGAGDRYYNGAGIGGAHGSRGGLITIYGGQIEANGGDSSAGIGSGGSAWGGTVYISGINTVVNAKGGWFFGQSDIATNLTVENGATVYLNSGGLDSNVSRYFDMCIIGGAGAIKKGIDGLYFSNFKVKGIIDVSAPTSGDGYSYEGNTITITTDGRYGFLGTTTENHIKVGSQVSADVILRNVSLDVSGTAFSVTDATANIVLLGENILNSGENYAGLQVPAGASLTISGNSTDSLTVTGGADSAGIGGSAGEAAGIITINGGRIYAAGGVGGAGIGGGAAGAGGTITITNGEVSANGGGNGAGIGGGNSGAGGTITINGGQISTTGGVGGAGIGGGDSGAGGTITINSGQITTTGGVGGAGIGGGNGGAGDTVTINGGGVNAAGEIDGAGIGGGNGGAGGTITISGGEVTALGNAGGAGLGGGKGGAGGAVSISGHYTIVNASGGTGGYDVGSGNENSAGGTVYLDGGAKLFLNVNGTNANVSATRGLIGGAGAGEFAGTYFQAKKINGIIDMSAPTSGDGYVYANNVVTIQEDGFYVFLGTTTTNTIKLNSGVAADILLENLNITVSGSPIDMTGAAANLILTGVNTLIGGYNSPGLLVPKGASLTIAENSTGTLNVRGGDLAAAVGSRAYEDAGTITINGGQVNVIFYTAFFSFRASGIGGGRYGAGGIVSIHGVDTVVNVDGGAYGDIIGSGDGNSNKGTLTVDGGATLNLTSGTGMTENITIGTATIGGWSAGDLAGIYFLGNKVTSVIDISSPAGGSGYIFENNTVTITEGGSYIFTGVTTANRITVSSGITANIGLSRVNIDASGTVNASAFNMTGATVNLQLLGENILKSGQNSAGLQVPNGAILTIVESSSGTLTVIGGNGAAGIGGGYQEDGGTINIYRGTVRAEGGTDGAGIGGGSMGAGGLVYIEGKTLAVAKGAAGGHDIGSGFNHANGGALGVDKSAVVEMLSSGTNAETNYLTCTIGGDGAGLYQGNYFNGKKVITINRFTVNPENGTDALNDISFLVEVNGLAYDEPTGYISVKRNGTEIGQAVISETGQVATFSTQLDWLGVKGGTYNFTAEYIQGNADPYVHTGQPTQISNYTINYLAQNPLAVTIPQGPFTYGDEPFNISVSGGSSTGNFSYVVTEGGAVSVDSNGKVTIEKAGSAEIVVTKAGDEYYSAVSETVVIHVNIAIPEVSFPTASSITYGQSLSESELLNGSGDGSFTWGAPATVPGVQNEGYTVVFTPYDVTNYDYSGIELQQTVSIVVNKKAITITADDQYKIYGDTDPELTYSITNGELVGEDILSGELSRASGENAGTYAISRGTLTAGENYNISFVDGTLFIEKKPLAVINAMAQNKVYDGNTEAEIIGAELNSNDIIGSDSVQLEGHTSGTFVQSAVGNDMAVYTSMTISGSDANNYRLYPPRKLMASINAKDLTITVNVTSKVYGSLDPIYTVTYTGFIDGENEGDLSGTLHISRDEGEDAGTYTLTPSGLHSNNYAITYETGDLVITPKSIVITAESKSKTYGDVDPELTYVVAEGSLVGDDALTGSLERVDGESAGTYAIGQGTLTAGYNYDITYVGTVLTIRPKGLTIKAEDKSKIYGEADPSFTVVFKGFILGEDENSLSGTLQISRAEGEGVGTYTITPSGLHSTNYTITYATGDLQITPLSITITANGQNKTYGNPDPVFTYELTSGSLINGDEITGTLGREKGENVGSYPLHIGDVTAGANYTITLIGANITVSPRAITVTAEDKSKFNGESDPALTYRLTSGSMVGGDSLTGSPVRIPGESVGSFTIKQGTLTAGPNYSITFLDGVFTIKPVPVPPPPPPPPVPTVPPSPVRPTPVPPLPPAPPAPPVPPAPNYSPGNVSPRNGIVPSESDNMVVRIEGVLTERNTSATGKIWDSYYLDKVYLEKRVGEEETSLRGYIKFSTSSLAREPGGKVSVRLTADDIAYLTEKNLGLEIEKDGQIIFLDSERIQKLFTFGKGIEIEIEPVEDDREVGAFIAIMENRAEGATILGSPLRIKTNFPGGALLTFSLEGIDIPTDPKERKEFLNLLAVFVEHSDGDTEVISGEINYSVEGEPVSISFGVNKFSIFAITLKDNSRDEITLPQQPKEGEPLGNYTIRFMTVSLILLLLMSAFVKFRGKSVRNNKMG